MNLKPQMNWKQIRDTYLEDKLSSFASLSAAFEVCTIEPKQTAIKKHPTPGKRISARLIRSSKK
jgi:hypothetical protein